MISYLSTHLVKLHLHKVTVCYHHGVGLPPAERKLTLNQISTTQAGRTRGHAFGNFLWTFLYFFARTLSGLQTFCGPWGSFWCTRFDMLHFELTAASKQKGFCSSVSKYRPCLFVNLLHIKSNGALRDVPLIQTTHSLHLHEGTQDRGKYIYVFKFQCSH